MNELLRLMPAIVIIVVFSLYSLRRGMKEKEIEREKESVRN